MIQGTDEWHAARLGKLTASRLPKAIARVKSGWAASRANLMADLIAERLTGVPAEGPVQTKAMLRGVEMEPKARGAYSFKHEAVEEVGFVPHPFIAMAGASPDGLVGSVGLVEIKCPNTSTHIDAILGCSLNGDYVTQMYWQMACCPGREWCDWVSYDDRLPEPMQMYVSRVDRNDKRISELEEMAEEFLDELAQKEKALRELYEIAA